jgi:hypothetical protein
MPKKNAEMLCVSREDAVSLFKALDFKTASRWNRKKLRAQLAGLAELIEDGFELEDEGLNDLLQAVITATKNEQAIDVEEKTEEPEEDEEAGAPVGDDDEEEAEEEDDEEAEDEAEDDEEEDELVEVKPKKPRKKPEASNRTKVGVIATVVQILQAASAKKAIPKKAIVAKLAEAFPDRDPEAMAKTVNIQVSSQLRKGKGLNVCKNENGYWIE